MTRGELARLALGTELVASRLRRRAVAQDGSVVILSADELLAISTRLHDCAAALRDVHTAMAPKDRVA